MIGIALVGLGVVWQNMFPASLWGWVAIGAGLGLGIATRQIQPARTPFDEPVLLLALMGGVSLWATAFPEITWAHHEKLDGSGYPRGLLAPAIPLQSRMMAIADIYDALVAWDRPYKRAVSVERALAILEDEARSGKLDRDLLALFVSARVYERTLPR